MIETDPGFDRTLPLALELSMQSRQFPPHEIVSGLRLCAAIRTRIVATPDEDRAFESKV